MVFLVLKFLFILFIASPTGFLIVDDDLEAIREEERRSPSPSPAECDQYSSAVSLTVFFLCCSITLNFIVNFSMEFSLFVIYLLASIFIFVSLLTNTCKTYM